MDRLTSVPTDSTPTLQSSGEPELGQAMAEPRMRRPSLGALLVNASLVTDEQVKFALAEGIRTGERLGEVVVRKGWVSDERIAELLAQQWQLRFLKTDALSIDPMAMRRIPLAIAKALDAVPVSFDANGIMLAVAEPSPELFAKVQEKIGDASYVVVARSALDSLLNSRLLASSAPREEERPAPAPVFVPPAPSAAETPADDDTPWGGHAGQDDRTGHEPSPLDQVVTGPWDVAPTDDAPAEAKHDTTGESDVPSFGEVEDEPEAHDAPTSVTPWRGLPADDDLREPAFPPYLRSVSTDEDDAPAEPESTWGDPGADDSSHDGPDDSATVTDLPEVPQAADEDQVDTLSWLHSGPRRDDPVHPPTQEDTDDVEPEATVTEAVAEEPPTTAEGAATELDARTHDADAASVRDDDPHGAAVGTADADATGDEAEAVDESEATEMTAETPTEADTHAEKAVLDTTEENETVSSTATETAPAPAPYEPIGEHEHGHEPTDGKNEAPSDNDGSVGAENALKSIDSASNELRVVHREVVDLARALAQAREQLAQREGLLAEQQKLLSEQQDQLASQQKQVAEQSTQLAEQQRQIADHLEQLQSADSVKQAHTDRISELESELNRRDDVFETLKHQVAKLTETVGVAHG